MHDEREREREWVRETRETCHVLFYARDVYTHTGPQGEKGELGPTGPPGLPGEKGARGKQGKRVSFSEVLRRTTTDQISRTVRNRIPSSPLLFFFEYLYYIWRKKKSILLPLLQNILLDYIHIILLPSFYFFFFFNWEFVTNFLCVFAYLHAMERKHVASSVVCLLHHVKHDTQLWTELDQRWFLGILWIIEIVYICIYSCLMGKQLYMYIQCVICIWE